MYLITGSTGMTGVAVLKHLEAIGHKEKVKCIVRQSSNLNLHNDIQLPIDYIFCDLETDELDSIEIEDIQVVLHIASIRYSKKIMDLANRISAKNVVLVHTALMYSKYFKYAKYFQRIEGELIQNHELPYTILRPTLLYGNSQDKSIHHIFKHLKSKRIYFLQGNNSVWYQPTYVGDLVGAIFDVVGNESCYYESFILSGKDQVKFGDLVRLIRGVTKFKCLIIPIPFAFMKLKMRIDELLHVKNGLTYKQVMRKIEDRRFAHGKAKDYFAYDPVSLEAGINIEYKTLKAEDVL